MALKAQEIMEGVLELSKAASEIENAKMVISELKQTKAQLERDVELLRKLKKEETEDFEKSKKRTQEEIGELKNIVQTLQDKRANLISGIVPEVQKLERLKEQLNSMKTNIENKEQEFLRREDNISKAQSLVESKKKIIEHIKELSKEL